MGWIQSNPSKWIALGPDHEYHFVALSTYSCFIFYIRSKLDQIDDINLSGLFIHTKSVEVWLYTHYRELQNKTCVASDEDYIKNTLYKCTNNKNINTHAQTRLTAFCPNLDFTEARDSEWQWHQLGHTQDCTSLQTDNHASTRQLIFLQAGCPSSRPTSSVKALMADEDHNKNTLYKE